MSYTRKNQKLIRFVTVFLVIVMLGGILLSTLSWYI